MSAISSEMQRERREEESLAQVRIASHKLDGLALPMLRRPQVPEGQPATPEEMQWSCRLYCYSILSHFREMLRSFLLLFDQHHIPAGLVICRCLFELGAYAYYTHKHVIQFLKLGNIQAAWDFLEEINMGSLHMCKQSVATQSEEPFPAPRHIAKVIQCFNETDPPSGATEVYDFFSELSHPGWASFKQYYSMTVDPEGFIRVDFTPPRIYPLIAYVPHVSFAVETTLRLVSDLLERTGQATMAEPVRAILTDPAGEAP